tara:strand:+ start:576 stop:887 length:312 start_codon:yes stop_codon:yes gene_type:complete
MTIIEYKLHPHHGGMRTPEFVTDGGYWQNPDDFTLIGTVPDGVEYYVPDSVVTYTLAELQTRQLGIHAKYPMGKPGNEPGSDFEVMTDDEIKTAIADWVATRE